jgi:hypothetical protein
MAWLRDRDGARLFTTPGEESTLAKFVRTGN